MVKHFVLNFVLLILTVISIYLLLNNTPIESIVSLFGLMFFVGFACIYQFARMRV